MAQISIYVDNKTSVKFLQMSKEERTSIRKVAQETLVAEINRVPEDSVVTSED